MWKKNLLVVAFSAVLFAMPLASFASDEKVEKKGKEESKECKLTKISIEDLKKAIEEKKVTIVDANNAESFAKGHIPGALSAKADGFEAKLPADKASLVVLYCGSEKCSGSKDLGEKITKLGFTNLKCFGAGLKGWTDAGGTLEK